MKTEIPNWIKKNIYEIIDKYALHPILQKDNDFIKKLRGVNIKSATLHDGFIEAEFDSLGFVNLTNERIVLDDVYGLGDKTGLRISTILFIINYNEVSLEIIAEQYNWPVEEVSFTWYYDEIKTIH